MMFDTKCVIRMYKIYNANVRERERESESER